MGRTRLLATQRPIPTLQLPMTSVETQTLTPMLVNNLWLKLLGVLKTRSLPSITLSGVSGTGA